MRQIGIGLVQLLWNENSFIYLVASICFANVFYLKGAKLHVKIILLTLLLAIFLFLLTFMLLNGSFINIASAYFLGFCIICLVVSFYSIKMKDIKFPYDFLKVSIVAIFIVLYLFY